MDVMDKDRKDKKDRMDRTDRTDRTDSNDSNENDSNDDNDENDSDDSSLCRFPAKGAFAFQQQVGCQADDHRQQRADCRGKAHGQQVIREQLGHEVRPRHTHQHDGQDVVQKR